MSGCRRKGKGGPGSLLEEVLVLQVQSCWLCPGMLTRSQGFLERGHLCADLNFYGTEGKDSGSIPCSRHPSPDSPWRQMWTHSALPGEEGVAVGAILR